MKTQTWLIILGICAIVLGGLGYYTTRNGDSSTAWSTYTNSAFGYSIKYPEGVRMTNNDSSDPNNPINNITLKDGNSALRITAPFSSPGAYPGYTKIQTMLAGQKATVVTISNTEKVYLVNAPSGYTITIDMNGTSDALNQALSTLLFTK